MSFYNLLFPLIWVSLFLTLYDGFKATYMVLSLSFPSFSLSSLTFSARLSLSVATRCANFSRGTSFFVRFGLGLIDHVLTLRFTFQHPGTSRTGAGAHHERGRHGFRFVPPSLKVRPTNERKTSPQIVSHRIDSIAPCYSLVAQHCRARSSLFFDYIHGALNNCLETFCIRNERGDVSLPLSVGTLPLRLRLSCCAVFVLLCLLCHILRLCSSLYALRHYALRVFVYCVSSCFCLCIFVFDSSTDCVCPELPM